MAWHGTTQHDMTLRTHILLYIYIYLFIRLQIRIYIYVSMCIYIYVKYVIEGVLSMGVSQIINVDRFYIINHPF